MLIVNQPATHHANEFPPFISDSTVFLVKGDKVMATAFVVAIRDNEQGNARRLYLVTARHNIERAGLNTVLKARHNITGSKYIESEYNTDDFRQHPTTDIAVHPLQLFSKLKEANIALDKLTSWGLDDYLMVRRDEIQDGYVACSSGVVVVSMFHLHTGEEFMQAIHRFGRIAMIPREKIEVSLGYSKQKIDSILIETMVWPGASGAPVFTNRSKPGKSIYDKVPLRLLGLLSSHFEIPTEDRTSKKISEFAEKIRKESSESNKSTTCSSPEQKTSPEITKVHLNTGISVVIPAYQIREFLLEIHKEQGGWLPQNTNFWEIQ
jgi:hypothetical protein